MPNSFIFETARRLASQCVPAAVVALSLGLGACAATAESGEEGVVLRTQEAGNVVTTVELADGTVRTVFVDGAGEERLEAMRNPDGEFSALLDGDDWAPAALSLLDVEALHETLHEVGATLPEVGAPPSAAGKADGETDAVVPGFYWTIPGTDNNTLNTCFGNGPGRGIQDHEFTGEPVADTFYEVADVTAASYTMYRRQVDAEGNLFGSDAHPEPGGENFLDRYDCTRAGPRFAACELVEIREGAPPMFDVTQLVQWDRPGGGFHYQLDHIRWSCDYEKYPDRLSEDFCAFIEDFWQFERLPCDYMSHGGENRPTGFPIIDTP